LDQYSLDQGESITLSLLIVGLTYIFVVTTWKNLIMDFICFGWLI